MGHPVYIFLLKIIYTLLHFLQHSWDLPSSSETSWEIPNNMAGLDKVVQKTKKNIQSKCNVNLTCQKVNT